MTVPPAPARPPEAPLDVQPQVLGRRPRNVTHPATPLWRKWLVALLAVALTVWAAREMHAVLDVMEVTALEWILLAAFTVNIGWIAFAFVSASIGFIWVIYWEVRGKAAARHEDSPIDARTAIVFPIYNEDVEAVFATVEATARSLVGEPAPFECFILSDTTDPDVALREEAVFERLRSRLAETGGVPVYYRRRTINLHRKSGNIHDFVSRWGGRYEYMIVFDADSYMETGTLVELVRRMEAQPETGLFQTIPQLVGAQTLFGRAQEFAAALYGPVLGAGVAWWSQSEGNFWGHNAIIRVRAFAEAADLPVMPGKAPFGGTILSHDFVEAALLRRAGWAVRVASDLRGSYEEGPPSIIDLVVRDRRWCQGNLQHIGVLVRTRGLAWTSRLHILIGIFSYLASPLWLFFILVGMLLSLQNSFLTPQYFGDSAALFPSWPVIDSERALGLFIATMGILFAPKIYGLIYGFLSARWRRDVGVAKTAWGVVVEIIVSVLVAPILMAEQTKAVFSVLLGQDTGWTPQQRAADGYRFVDCLRHHGRATLLGFALVVAAFAISPVFAAWLSPAAIGMLLAAPLSWWSGQGRSGRIAQRAGALITPQESHPPACLSAALAIRAGNGSLARESFETLLADPVAQKKRAYLVDPHWPLEGMNVHEPLALAVARAARTQTRAALNRALPPKEKLALLNSPADLGAVQQRLADAAE